ncbi:dephospho-CoA kinase [Dongia deserti]|uniref:dephospho-CoA kinase n=1 Tax=Dongia deserti TaxID=2268030 RepID=UPI000E646B85|nr:dephospho-CoA kinase [Dongia deserti]
MRVLGLTGSIAMGKSTAAAMLRRMGVPVHDADEVVHNLTRPGGKALPAIKQHFPDLVTEAGLNRPELSKRAFKDPAVLQTLERILHPMVRAEERRFLARERAKGSNLVVLDIPLLFETGGEKRCDAVLVVSAPRAVQLQRVLSRPAMTLAKLKGIEQRQMSDAEKRKRADIVIPTGRGKRATWAALKRAVGKLQRRSA